MSQKLEYEIPFMRILSICVNELMFLEEEGHVNSVSHLYRGLSIHLHLNPYFILI